MRDEGAFVMRPDRASKHGRWLSVLAAGAVGFLLGDWHGTTLSPTDLSPSQNVALRFFEANADAALADPAAGAPTGATSVSVLGDAQLALLSPDPMVPPPAPQRVPQAPVQAPAPEAAIAAPPPETAPAPRPAPTAAQLQAALKKPAVESASRHANRPGYMLNDAQIASIKARLHLTPDQERMWPAVEAALRNVAYANTRERRHGSPGTTEVASLDPDSAAVQGLKSAAVPLIMSFSDQQKSEVRSLAHVMGLDKLASEF